MYYTSHIFSNEAIAVESISWFNVTMSKLLIVEDECSLHNFLKQELNKKGICIVSAYNGQEGLYFAQEYTFDLAIIDLGLPILSGLELIKNIRKKNIATPLIILTARGQWYDKVEGLACGADDYVVKPFHIEELWARITVLLRRNVNSRKDLLMLGPIRLSLMKQQVFVNECLLELTAYEYKILEYFMLNPGQLITKTEIVEHIYHDDFEKDSNVIEVLVGRLRKKIKSFYPGLLIKTLRGRGYVLEN